MADDERARAEREARAEMEARGGAARARELLRRRRVAVLATASARHGGAPFTSLAPFALSAAGEPVLLLSALAQHTRNLEADPRASLFVHDPAAEEEDPRTAERLSIVGRVARVSAADEPDARSRYLARHPEARGLFALDFSLYVLAMEEAQLVGGFGSAGWLTGEALRGPSP
ncbi:MAG TPA: pyridoxamine 5'-phosphate oxidase family protein [Anaeromyxobacter sp.]